MIKLFMASIKTSTLLLLISASSHSFALSESGCEHLNGCEKKSCEIKRSLDIANKVDNKRKADGLATALSENAENCTNKGLKDDLVEKIEGSKEDIAEYRIDLQEAEKYGKTKKVQKYKAKIEKEEKEIMYLEKKLSDLV